MFWRSALSATACRLCEAASSRASSVAAVSGGGLVSVSYLPSGRAAAETFWPTASRLTQQHFSFSSSAATEEVKATKEEKYPHLAFPTKTLVEIIRENREISTSNLWKEVQSRQETSEGARAIPHKRQMKLLLKFMKKSFKVKAYRGKTSYVYKLHPWFLAKERRRLERVEAAQ